MIESLAAKDVEIARLKERLEIAYVYDREGHKQPAPEGIPDGIECRDATIKQLEERITAKDALLEQAREGLNKIRYAYRPITTPNDREPAFVMATQTLAAINAAIGENLKPLDADFANVLEENLSEILARW